MGKIQNPITGDAVAERHAEHIVKLRAIRSNARREARSGNPAKRYPALHAVALAVAEIRRVYIADARAKAGAR